MRDDRTRTRPRGEAEIRSADTGLEGADAAGRFGMPYTIFAQFDIPTSAKQTEEPFDWRPFEPGLLADIDSGNY